MTAPNPCAVIQKRLERRGFRGLSQEEACRIGPWMRFTPMLQALLFGVSTVAASVPVLRVMAGVLLFGLITGRHPFDWIYEGLIRPLEKTPRLPSTPPRRRAVFLLGAFWCYITAHFFAVGNTETAFALGAVMTASTALLAVTHICIPSTVVAWVADKAGRAHA